MENYKTTYYISQTFIHSVFTYKPIPTWQYYTECCYPFLVFVSLILKFVTEETSVEWMLSSTSFTFEPLFLGVKNHVFANYISDIECDYRSDLIQLIHSFSSLQYLNQVYDHTADKSNLIVHIWLISDLFMAVWKAHYRFFHPPKKIWFHQPLYVVLNRIGMW